MTRLRIAASLVSAIIDTEPSTARCQKSEAKATLLGNVLVRLEFAPCGYGELIRYKRCCSPMAELSSHEVVEAVAVIVPLISVQRP